MLNKDFYFVLIFLSLSFKVSKKFFSSILIPLREQTLDKLFLKKSSEIDVIVHFNFKICNSVYNTVKYILYVFFY